MGRGKELNLTPHKIKLSRKKSIAAQAIKYKMSQQTQPSPTVQM